MDAEAAREVKQELQGSLPARAVRPRGVALPGRGAVGLSVQGPGRYGVAVRHSGPLGEVLAERALALAGSDADVREVGRVVALSQPPGAGRWSPAALQQRARPLRPGLSIAHERVSAGTLGAFVTATGLPGVLVLSNDHVLGDSGRARLGDDVLQPGPADGGTLPRDRVGSLARTVPLDPAALGGQRPRVDAALAQLDDADGFDPTYPAGRLVGWADADDEVLVEKVGRTTGVTRGRITAIELDDVVVEFPVGPVAFDDQVEVTGLAGAFSAGGDSGSLVYRPGARQAVGLLFAGSERGGDGDPASVGLTFANPIGAVLDALGATLVL